MSDDSDDELLTNLLSIANDDEGAIKNPPKPTDSIKADADPNLSQQSQPSQASVVTEFDLNFDLEFAEEFFDNEMKVETPKTVKKTAIKSTAPVTEEQENSSDDEDKKYFEKQRYTDYGREIKNLLKRDSENSISTFGTRNSFNGPPLANKNNATPRDVYSDPVFGIRLVKPLISSAELIEKMQGRKAVTVTTIKLHLSSQTADEDWVIAGTLLNKSAPKTSQKGNHYCIWKISDLSQDMSTVSIFLFKDAHKSLWKTSTGTVVGILNPSVLESRGDQDLATLSVESAQRVIILGNSKDLGRCKSVKKNGEPCTAPVNLSRCEYCVYHVKQEYSKYTKRSDLQIDSARGSFGAPVNALKPGNFQQRHPQATPFIAIRAERNAAQHRKDSERLALLRGDAKPQEKSKVQSEILPEMKKKTSSVELTSSQMKKDLDRLKKLRGWNTDQNGLSPAHAELKKIPLLSQLQPKLGTGMVGGIIDLSSPIQKNQINKAKLNAIEWAKKNGGIKKTNPNKIHQDKEILSQNGFKRKREDEVKSAVETEKKKEAVKSKFQEMMELTSSHSDLIEQRQDEETEEYFQKLEVKERMEEKMLSTFKVECKAVRCNVCKYIAFSSSDLCKQLQHPIKVINAVKRFFKCGDCGNRTISLDRIPSETCKRCSSSKWVRAAMMDEKRTEIAGSKLCIRGGEEKFIGSTITDASLNLLVPDTD
ncbi:hypothetical protein QAD02_015517 [Eretmocerus hayati]|uniref:Uncharacterized protein n=1 Tax=Eretmocerus hayati TaxID=131215 RepID=A0ACC2P8I9_9HYME|nr:hypothetical protein QAD02_015517 [Eretmocerus hayati]